MNYSLSLFVVSTAVFFLVAPMLCGITGAPIGAVLWFVFVAPVLLVLVNLLDEGKAYVVAYGQAILLAIIIVVSCIDNAVNRMRRGEETPPPDFPKGIHFGEKAV
jgi:uncharacterized membrane protein YjdF